MGQYLADNRETQEPVHTIYKTSSNIGQINNTNALNYNSIVYKDLIETENKYVDIQEKTILFKNQH